MSDRYELAHEIVAHNGDVVRVYECQDCFHRQLVMGSGRAIHDAMHDAGRISGESDPPPYKGTS